MARQRKQTIISAVCAAVAVLGVFAYTASVRLPWHVRRRYTATAVNAWRSW